MEAFERGEEIEYTSDDISGWHTTPTPAFDWRKCIYRIKSKPKQTVIIEKWLVTNGMRFDIAETSDINAYLSEGIVWTKLKLLATYEEELQ